MTPALLGIGEAVSAVSWALLLHEAMAVLPGVLLLTLATVLAIVLAWRHTRRNGERPGWRFSLAYFRDAALLLLMLVVAGMGAAIIMGWVQLGG